MTAHHLGLLPVTTRCSHRDFRKAADQPDGPPASLASGKLPFVTLHSRPRPAAGLFRLNVGNKLESDTQSSGAQSSVMLIDEPIT